MKEFQGKNLPVEELLSLKFFNLHVGQRRYEWTESHVETFILDIKNSIDDKENTNSKYFIGTVILIENEDDNQIKSLTIVDGQQRITTILLTISVLKDICASKAILSTDEKYKEYASLLDQYLMTKDISQKGPVFRYRLSVSNNDREIFEKLIRNKKIEQSQIKTLSNEKLIEAKLKIKEIINEYSEEELFSFIFALLKTVEIVELTTKDEETAYVLFENINTRSLSLGPSDLMKNMFLKNIDDNMREELEGQWDEFINNLTPARINRKNFPGGVTPTNFLKHYIMSKGEYISKKDIYLYFNKLDLNKNEISKELQVLKNKSLKYIKFLNGEGNKSISNIKLLGLKQTIIVLLACSDLDENTLKEISYLLEKVAFCYVIGDLRTNTLESIFTEVAGLITNKKINEAKSKLKNLINDNKDIVLEAFKNKMFDTRLKKKKAKYILVKLGELLDNVDYSTLEIEHILPEERSKLWNIYSDEEWYRDIDMYNKYMSNIGNMTLLKRNDNASIKDKYYTEKCKVYKNYGKLTSTIVEIPKTGTVNTKMDKLLSECKYIPTKNWGPDEIKKRAIWMANLAEYIWFDKEL